jgi:hypothetical protein
MKERTSAMDQTHHSDHAPLTSPWRPDVAI